MPKALVTCHHLQRFFEDFRPAYEAAGVEPILPKIAGQQLDAAGMRAAIAGVDAVIAGDDEIDASVLEAGKAAGLKAVIKWGIGTDSIDKAKAAELGIPVYNTPGTFANEVADLALRAHVGQEALAVDHLHREEAVLRLDEELVEVDEVGVRDVREGPELALEAVERVGLGVRQRLQGDDAIALAIVGLEHHAHRAGAEAAADLEAIDGACVGVLVHVP